MSIDRTIAALPGMTTSQREQVRLNAERWRDAGTPQQRADGEQVLAAMAALMEAEHAALAQRLGAMEAPRRVVEAFRARQMTPTEEKLLQVLLDNPGSTSKQLSREAGWGGQSWHLLFGTMCRERAEYLWPAPRAEKRDDNFLCGILADFEGEGSQFTMKAEVAAALATLGLKASSR